VFTCVIFRMHFFTRFKNDIVLIMDQHLFIHTYVIVFDLKNLFTTLHMKVCVQHRHCLSREWHNHLHHYFGNMKSFHLQKCKLYYTMRLLITKLYVRGTKHIIILKQDQIIQTMPRMLLRAIVRLWLELDIDICVIFGNRYRSGLLQIHAYLW
jgi:hypothetical protein